MLFKICKLAFIFHFIRIYLGFCTSTLQDTHVCILQKECIIPVDNDISSKSFYISPDINCLSTKLGVKLEPKKVGTNYFIKWTPEVKYIGTESIKLCTFKASSLLDPVTIRTIQLKQLEYEYSLDDNNDLDIVLTNSIPEDVKLVISKTKPFTNNDNITPFEFVKFYEKLVSHAPLFKLLDKLKPFTSVYVYIHYHKLSEYPTLLERLIIFNIDKVTSLKRDVVDKHIVAEMKGVDLNELKPLVSSFDINNPQESFFISAQSKDDTTGIPSKCGSPDTLWHILDLPYKFKVENNDKSIITLLPLELYGKSVKLCAGFKKEELKNYYMYLYTFEASNRASKYFKNEFYASPLGVAEIALESDFHPLSEIMLINPCDIDSKDDLRKSFPDLKPCKPITEPKLAHRQVNAEYKANHSYDVEDLYLSIYNKEMFSNYLVASKPMYLPDKSVLTKTGTKWIKKPIFLPGLYSDHEFPYVMLLCDRWKHTFCFTKEEFDTPIGIIKASDYTVHEVTSSWTRETLSVSLKMRVQDPPVIKIVMSKDVQYADYESKCNTYKGTYPPIPKPPKKKAAFYTHVYKTDRLLQGRLYYICILKVKNQTSYPDDLKQFYSNQKSELTNPLKTHLDSHPYWNFVGIVNTQTVISDTRYSFNKLEKQGNYVFPTTGFNAELLISGIYFSKNMLLDCERLRSSHRLPIPQNKYEFSDLVSFVKNCRDTFAPVKRPIVLPRSDGFWLSKDKKHWKMKGKYISYSGPFKPTENTYKVCICIHKECYFSGNATNSRIDSFSLSQFVKINDFFDRIVIGNLLCIYNRRLAMCYDARDNFKLSIEHEIQFYLPQIQINHISFDDYTNLVCILSPNIIYVYENNFESHMKIMNVLDMKQMFSFPEVTFFLDVDTLYAYIDKLSIHQAIVGSMNDFGFTSQNIEYDHEPLRRDEPEKMISLDIPINDKTENLNIIKADTKNTFECFLVNEKLELIYYEIKVDMDPNNCTIKEVTKLDLKEHFPAATDGIILEVDKRSLFGLDVQIFFASHHEYDDIKIFFLKHNKFTFYSDVKAIKGIRDFVFTKTHIICLGSLLLQDELTQQIIQIEYDNLFDVTLSYPTIEQVIYGNEYSFDATVSSNFVLKYYLDPNKSHIDIPRGAPIQFEIKRSGLSLNSGTGQITGRANFVGPLEQTIYVDAFLSKGSTTVRFVSKCPVGYQAGGNNTCEKCPKGFYRHKLAVDGCVSCEDYLRHSTTTSDGTQSPLECVCNPGFFKSNNLCVECPAGTYNNDLGALACDGTCPKNQESQVTGASSLEELKCTCVRGFYMGEYQCERCVTGTYCPGNSKVARCPENTTTRQPGSFKPEDCVCIAGYELVGNACRPCDTRSYKPTIGNERCTPCSLDSYDIQSFTQRPGAITKVECNRCQFGHYFNGTSCAFCPENSFCKGGGFQPVKCGENSIIKKETATGLYDCVCPRGYGFNSAEFNSLRPRDCVKCPVNTFQFIDGTHQPCLECPENTYTLAEGSTSLLDCIPLSGYFTPMQSEYSEKVRALESNHLSLNEQQLQSLPAKCFRASADAMSYHVVLTRRFEECVQMCKSNPHCKHLYYRPMGGNSNIFSEGANNICATYTTFDPKIPDKIGEEPISNPLDADGPLLCEIEREYVYPKFVPCSRNHYCPGGISSQMIKCPKNAVTLHEGAASLDECLCLPGKYLHNGSCVPCKLGYYKPAVSNAACTSCPENMTTAQQGSLAPTQCACVNNMYAVSLKRSADVEIRRLIYVGEGVDEQQSVLDEQHIDNHIDKIIQQTFEVPATARLDYYCANCEHGYFCRGLWLARNVHMPPVPCFPGSSVPASASSHSISACLCDPGYGTSQQEFGADSGFGLLCEPCPPGTFKAVHENSACHGTCPVFATSRPGSSSESDCFCLPGYYMERADGQMSCRACPEGMVCHGGMDGAAHTRPTPRPGFGLVSVPPPDGATHEDPALFPVACPHPDRCVGENRCAEGSAGLLCTECAPGYDTRHFGSGCTACRNELGKMVLRRAPLYLFLVALYYYNFFFDRHSDSPLVPALKITHAFLASLTPLGLMHSTSRSSLRAHRGLYNSFIEAGFWSYTKTARLNCFREELLSLVRLLNKIRPKSQPIEPESLEYRHIWYLQRYFSIFWLLFDVCAVLLIGAVCQLVNWLIRLHNGRIVKKLDSFASRLDDSGMSLASVHSEHDLVEVRSRRRGVYRPLLAVLVLIQLPHLFLNCLAMLRCTQLAPAGQRVLLFMPSQVCSTSSPLFLAGLFVGCATMGLMAALVALLFFLLARCKDVSGWTNMLASGCRPRYRYWYLVQLVRQTLMVALVAMQLSTDAAASEMFVQASVLAVHVAYLLLLRWLEPYDARAGSLLAYMDTKYTCVTIFAALFLFGAHLYHYAEYALLPLLAAILSSLSVSTSVSIATTSFLCAALNRHWPLRRMLSQCPLLFNYDNAFLYFNYKDDTLVFESSNLVRRANALCGLYVHTRQDRRFLLRCLRDLTQQCVVRQSGRSFSPRFFYFYVRLIFWYARCLDTNVLRAEAAPLDYIAFLYYFDEALRPRVCWLLFHYPLNSVRSHLCYYHQSFRCEEGCRAFYLRPPNECVDELAACLLADLLFERHYDAMRLSLADFQHALLALSRIEPAKINRVFEFYQTQLEFSRHRGRYMHNYELGSLSSEISTLKELIKLDDRQGALKVSQQELAQQLELLRRDVAHLSESIEHRSRVVDAARKNFTRTSVLKVGVESVIAGKLTNDDILSSISRLGQGAAEARSASILKSKRGKRESIYKLKLT